MEAELEIVFVPIVDEATAARFWEAIYSLTRIIEEDSQEARTEEEA